MDYFKLYFSPTSSGTANYIVASLGGLTLDSETVDVLGTHKTQSGKDFFKVNPNGNVPTIVFADGSAITQNTACLTYLAERAQHARLAPKFGTECRYRYFYKLGFVNSEPHPAFGSLFNPRLSASERATNIKVARAKFIFFIEKVLGGAFALGSFFSAVDVYAHIVFTWASFVDVNLSGIPEVVNYCGRVKAVLGVMEAHKKMTAVSSA